MAFVRPSLVADRTETAGTGSYTLNDEASPGAGLRTLADAVTDGDAANSDTISYFVVDTTTEGAALEWEHGVGTIGSGGLSLARTQVLESSNGDAAVSWPSGGARTIRFGAGTQGFAQLAAANTFTGTNIFTTSIAVDSVGSAQNIDVGSDQSSSTIGRLRFMGHNASAADVNYAAISGSVVSATAGSESGRLNFTLRTAGTPTVIADIDADGLNVLSGTLQQGGTNVALQGVLSAPSGTRLTFHTTPPTGWSRVNVTGERMIKLAESGDTIGATGGSWTISGLSTTVNGHTLTEAEMPSHQHTVYEFTASTDDAGGMSFTAGLNVDPAGLSNNDQLTSATGEGDPHSHTASTTAGSSWRPAFSIACIGEKS